MGKGTDYESAKKRVFSLQADALYAKKTRKTLTTYCFTTP